MLTMTYNRRQGLSILLVLSMFLCMWLSVSPMQKANAGILSSLGSIAKTLLISAGSLAGGAMGAVLGAAVGGGPLGMAIGGVAGYIVSKKVLNWTTSSVANFATVAGAVGGGLLCAGMGFPMLAIGIVGGGLISRLLVKGVSALINKIKGSATSTGKAESVITEEDANSFSEVVKETPKEESSSSIDSQTAYNNYIEAYEEYVKCAQSGDTKGAKAAYERYSTNQELYQALLKAGK